jgi:hypothetical protein
VQTLLEYLPLYFRYVTARPVRARLAPLAVVLSLLLPAMAPAAERTVLKLYTVGATTPTRSFTLAQLKMLPAATIETDLPESLQIRGHHVWTGVPLEAVAGLLGGDAVTLRLTALNDYSITIPLDDIRTYKPVLAYNRDGQDITIRDKGPLIVIYPFGRYPQLEQQVYLNRTIWQVGEIRAE